VPEHVLEPRQLPERTHEKPSRGGILYVEVPNIPPRVLRRYLDHRLAPRYDEPHIAFFSVRTLENLVGSIFELRFCDTAGPV
jgi:hypothetical protein